MHAIKFVASIRRKVAGSVHVIVEINNDPKRQSDIPYLDLDRLDNPNFQIGLSPLDEYYDLERETYIPKNEPVNLSKIEITYLKK